MDLSIFKPGYAYLLCFSLLFFSCSSDEETVEEVEFSQEDNKMAAQVDLVFEGTLNIMEIAYIEEEEGRSNSFSHRVPPFQFRRLARLFNLKLILEKDVRCLMVLLSREKFYFLMVP